MLHKLYALHFLRTQNIFEFYNTGATEEYFRVIIDCEFDF